MADILTVVYWMKVCEHWSTLDAYTYVTRIHRLMLLFQAYGLPFWKNMPSWARAIPSAIFIVIVVTAYNFIKDTQGRRFTRIAEIIRIPGIYYLILLIAWLIIVLVMKIQQVLESRAAGNLTNKESKARKASGRPTRPSTLKEVLVISGVVLTYVICVFLSWIFEYLDWKVNLIVLTMIYCFSFTLISAIGGSFLLAMILPMKKRSSHQHSVESTNL